MATGGAGWAVPVGAEELGVIERAAAAFRERWAAIRPPWGHGFDFTARDVRAMDYLEYEGLGLPACGVEGAGLVCGEVLRRAAGLVWVRSHGGEWFVTSADWPGVAICPVVGVREVYFGGVPQFGRFSWYVCRAALECFRVAEGRALVGLIGELDDGEFLHDVERTLGRVKEGLGK